VNLINKFFLFPRVEHTLSFIPLFLCCSHKSFFSFLYSRTFPNDTFSPDWFLMASIQYFINSLTDKLQCCILQRMSTWPHNLSSFLKRNESTVLVLVVWTTKKNFWLIKIFFYDLNVYWENVLVAPIGSTKSLDYTNQNSGYCN